MVVRVIVILAIAVIGVGVYLLVGGGDDRDDSGEIEEEGEVSVFDLRVNDCLTDLPEGEGEQTSIKATPCDKPHEAQVFTIIDLGGGDYPGNEVVSGKARRGCPARLRRLKPAVEVGLYNFQPTEESWDSRDDHSISCIAVYEKPVTGLLKDQKKT